MLALILIEIIIQFYCFSPSLAIEVSHGNEEREGELGHGREGGRHCNHDCSIGMSYAAIYGYTY